MYKDKKIAFIFPGQGAQYVGMANDFIESSSENKKILEKFDKDHSTVLLEIMTNGPEELLKDTKFTQPAILFHSICALNALKKAQPDIQADFLAGHSLGEFSALVASGVLPLSQAMHLVHKRGEFMISANSGKSFAMSAIIGLSPKDVKELCDIASKVDTVVAANYNTPVQTVISGSFDGVQEAGKLAIEKGAMKVIPLTVGGPFHSPLISKAGEMLKQEMQKMEFKKAETPIISNIDAKATVEPKKIKEKLVKQVSSSVLWVDSVLELLEKGVEIFIEFGPGRATSGMIKKIYRKASIFNVDKLVDVKNVIAKLDK